MRGLTIILLGIFSLTSALAAPIARAAPPIIRVQAAPENDADSNKHAVDVAVAEATNAADLESTIDWAEKDLAQARALSPSLRQEVVVAAPDGDGQPEALPLTKTTFRQAARDLFAKHYRVSFAVIRGLANSSVVTWGLILSSHFALAAALPVGLVAGSMSAGLQLFNQRYNAWLLKSKTAPGQLSRNMVSNTIYMAITKFVSAVAHVPPENTLAVAATAVLKSSFLGTFAQGTWSLAFAKLQKLQIAQHPESAGRFQRIADMKALVNSMVSTGLSVASMLGAPMTDAAMLVMGAGGAAYYGWVTIKERKWVKSRAEAVSLACESNLTH